MAENAKSIQRAPGRGKSRTWTHAERLEAIAPLVTLSSVTDEQVLTRSAEVAASSRSLRRWIADAKGRESSGPRKTRLAFKFPEIAVLVAIAHANGLSAFAIHKELVAKWATLYPEKRCPSYQTILAYLRETSAPRLSAEPRS